MLHSGFVTTNCGLYQFRNGRIDEVGLHADFRPYVCGKPGIWVENSGGAGLFPFKTEREPWFIVELRFTY